MTVAFGSSEFGAGVHFITNVVDGLYGNGHSWIPDFNTPDPKPFVGLNFGATLELRNIAWGRDNGDAGDCCGGELRDRALGLYTLQITRIPQPGPTTPDTGDPATGWARFRKRFPAAPGLLRVSRVAVDDPQLQALVYVEFACGPECGTGRLIRLARSGEAWLVQSGELVWVAGS